MKISRDTFSDLLNAIDSLDQELQAVTDTRGVVRSEGVDALKLKNRLEEFLVKSETYSLDR